MKIKHLGDRVEVSQTVEEINSIAVSKGLPPPILILNPFVAASQIEITEWMTPVQFKSRFEDGDEEINRESN